MRRISGLRQGLECEFWKRIWIFMNCIGTNFNTSTESSSNRFCIKWMTFHLKTMKPPWGLQFLVFYSCCLRTSAVKLWCRQLVTTRTQSYAQATSRTTAWRTGICSTTTIKTLLRFSLLTLTTFWLSVPAPTPPYVIGLTCHISYVQFRFSASWFLKNFLSTKLFPCCKTYADVSFSW